MIFKNVCVIAGYDVLAYENPAHREYVGASLRQAIREKVEMIFTIGGATNPDYPKKTEAEANEKIIRELQEKFPSLEEFDAISVIALPIGDTSAETLIVVKNYLQKNQISVAKLILCAEQSGITGFMNDALFVGFLDISEEIFAYGHQFPESKQGFDSQRRKMLFKVLSHRSKFFRYIRELCQKVHQYKVARLKRKQK